MEKNIRRDIIMKHYENPINKGLIQDSEYIKQRTKHSSCIDQIDIMIHVQDNIVKDIRFDGEACAITISATSILIETLLGKTTEEAKEILTNYQQMIEEKPFNEKILKDLIVYDDISKQPNRKQCALLPVEAILEIIKKLDN